ncbi:MAG: sigma-70 family RNA polymerase sigma factor [Chloroflexi bacterium]|nr:MAG: sigma-70 family RNA polymerase sigma factor [Chloroflexota bacterium]
MARHAPFEVRCLIVAHAPRTASGTDASENIVVKVEARTAAAPDSFESLAERHRRELQVHCYRMLGSIHDAEDVVQEALLRAWRGLDGFEGRTSFRGWLYRIATNACLTALSRRAHGRVLPEDEGPPVAFAPLGSPSSDVAWLEPYPDSALEGIPDDAPGPDARYEMREAVQLAFVAALQELPPRQRAALLLRDVLGLSAAEASATLDASVASTNSALQRARATLKQRSSDRRDTLPVSDERQRSLLVRYVKTWEERDIDGFVALLKEDAAWSMPPWRQWYVGRPNIRAFMGWAWRSRRRQLLLPIATNGQHGFAYYRAEAEGSEWQAFAIQVVTLRGDAIAAITNFVDADLFRPFGLPRALPADYRPDR